VCGQSRATNIFLTRRSLQVWPLSWACARLKVRAGSHNVICLCSVYPMALGHLPAHKRENTGPYLLLGVMPTWTRFLFSLLSVVYA